MNFTNRSTEELNVTNTNSDEILDKENRKNIQSIIIIILVVGLVLMLIVSVMIYFFFCRKKKKNKVIKSENKKENEKEKPTAVLKKFYIKPIYGTTAPMDNANKNEQFNENEVSFERNNNLDYIEEENKKKMIKLQTAVYGCNNGGLKNNIQNNITNDNKYKKVSDTSRDLLNKTNFETSIM